MSELLEPCASNKVHLLFVIELLRNLEPWKSFLMTSPLPTIVYVDPVSKFSQTSTTMYQLSLCTLKTTTFFNSYEHRSVRWEICYSTMDLSTESVTNSCIHNHVYLAIVGVYGITPVHPSSLYSELGIKLTSIPPAQLFYDTDLH